MSRRTALVLLWAALLLSNLAWLWHSAIAGIGEWYAQRRIESLEFADARHRGANREMALLLLALARDQPRRTIIGAIARARNVEAEEAGEAGEGWVRVGEVWLFFDSNGELRRVADKARIPLSEVFEPPGGKAGCPPDEPPPPAAPRCREPGPAGQLERRE